LRGHVRIAGTKLAEKQPEPAHGEAYTHQAQSRANPGQECSLRCQVHPGVLLCGLVHGGIVLLPNPRWRRFATVILKETIGALC
jgi:hypothetical protein